MFVNSSTELMSRMVGARVIELLHRRDVQHYFSFLPPLPHYPRKGLAYKGYENRQVHEPYCNAHKCTRKLLLSTEAVVETWSCASPEL